MPRNRSARHLSSGGFEYYVEPDDQRLARPDFDALADCRANGGVDFDDLRADLGL